MRAFNNLKLLGKLAIPSLILILVAVGLVAMARSSLATLEQNTTEIIEVRAARLFLAQKLALAIDEAVIAEKNAIIETDEALMKTESAHYQSNRTSASEAVERLLALADTPERRAILTDIRADLQAFFTAAERSISHALRNEKDTAGRMAVTDEEFAKRRAAWTPRANSAASGYLWKYQQTVGPAVNGAVTHPGGAEETHTYADI